MNINFKWYTDYSIKLKNRIAGLKTIKYDAKWIKMGFGSFDRPIARRSVQFIGEFHGFSEMTNINGCSLSLSLEVIGGICKWALSNFFSSKMDLLICKYKKFWQRGTVDYLILRWLLRTVRVFFKLFSLSQYQRNLYWVMLVRNSNTFFLTDIIIYVYMNTFLLHVSQYLINSTDDTVSVG